jgi:hypothetical protein
MRRLPSASSLRAWSDFHYYEHFYEEEETSGVFVLTLQEKMKREAAYLFDPGLNVAETRLASP